jgi:S-adenosylmethionine hydrolase
MQQTGTKRKRVGEQGDWEYECTCCERWLEKARFRGCVNFVDAYGNCLICTSCRSKNTKQKQMEEDKANAKKLLEIIGFYKHQDSEAWLTASKKKNEA